jgi:CRP-like cAMP-binding protein
LILQISESLSSERGNGLETQEPTTGLILWLNQRGILLDPPAYSCEALQKIGLPPTLLDKVILTQCSADHDVGLMQRVLGSSVIELITTPTIMELFVSKYSALLCISPEELKKLFQFRPVTLGHPLILFGATLTFAYSFFAIPTLNFEVSHLNKSFFFSGSTLYSQSKLKSLLNDSHLFSKGRFEELANKDWSRYDLIFHEAAGEPSQTTLESLNHLPEDVKMKIKVYGVSTKKLEDTEVDLERVEVGLSNTYVLVQDGVGDSAMRNLEIIGGLDIFDQIPLKRICDLVRSIKDVKFKQGEFVVREGTKGHKFYILRRGVCKIYSRKTGKEFSKYIYSGDHFGESAMIGDGIRLANVFAETNVLLLEIDKADFLWCLGEQAQSTAVRLMKRLNELRQTPYSEYLNKYAFFIQKQFLVSPDRTSEDRSQYEDRSGSYRARSNCLAEELSG